jgi:hypothetical protein
MATKKNKTKPAVEKSTNILPFQKKVDAAPKADPAPPEAFGKTVEVTVDEKNELIGLDQAIGQMQNEAGGMALSVLNALLVIRERAANAQKARQERTMEVARAHGVNVDGEERWNYDLHSGKFTRVG